MRIQLLLAAMALILFISSCKDFAGKKFIGTWTNTVYGDTVYISCNDNDVFVLCMHADTTNQYKYLYRLTGDDDLSAIPNFMSKIHYDNVTQELVIGDLPNNYYDKVE